MGQKWLAACVLVIGGGLVADAVPAQAQDGYKIIVNSANPLEALTKSEAARLFLSRTTWDSGDPVFAVDLTPGSPVREDFSREVLGMSGAAATNQWKRIAGNPPPTVASDREVLAFVRLKRGGIGYVSASTKLQGVKVIPIVKAGR